MRKLSLPQKKTSFLMYLFVYYLIIGSDCVLFCYNKNEMMVKGSQYFMVFLSLTFLFMKFYKNKGIRKKDLFLFITVAFLFFSALIHNEFTGGYISIISLFVLGYCFFDVIDPDEFIKVFLNLMTVICIVSLFTFVFSFFVCKLPFFPSIYNNMDREYRFFFFSNILMINPERNFGIFTEPSRFQAYLNLCLILMIFTQKHKLDIKRIVLFIVCLITTFSTTGYVAFAFIFMAFVFSKRVKIKSLYKFLIVSVFILAVVILFTQNEVFFDSINKITLAEKSYSAATRFNSFFATIKIILENVFFGTGIAKADAAFTTALSDLGGLFASANTVTILIIYSKFGIVPGLFYTYNMFHAVKAISNKNNAVILLFAFIAMTSGISFVDSIIFSIIIFYRNKESVINLAEEKKNESFSYKFRSIRKHG